LKYKDQAIWFLNGFWGDGVGVEDAGKVWQYVKKFVELDLMGPDRKGAEGTELDPFWSAKFLEDMDIALPSIERKNALRTIDVNSNGRMATLEYLAWKYKKGVKETIDAPQGDNTEAIKAAQKKLDEVSAKLTDCDTKLNASKEEKVKVEAAQKESDAAMADLKKEQDAYNAKLADLTEKSTNGTGVAKSKAANELAQLKNEDPLPLRKAKLTQEATARKLEKQQKALAQAIESLEAAYVSLEKAMTEAQRDLDAIKNKPGGGKGALWWMQREMFEADDRLPRAKQRFDHSKPFDYSP